MIATGSGGDDRMLIFVVHALSSSNFEDDHSDDERDTDGIHRKRSPVITYLLRTRSSKQCCFTLFDTVAVPANPA